MHYPTSGWQLATLDATRFFTFSDRPSRSKDRNALAVKTFRLKIQGTAGNGGPMHPTGYPTQDTSRIGTASVKQKEEAYMRIKEIEW